MNFHPLKWLGGQVSFFLNFQPLSYGMTAVLLKNCLKPNRQEVDGATGLSCGDKICGMCGAKPDVKNSIDFSTTEGSVKVKVISNSNCLC